MFFDSHCHVHFNAYKEDMDEVIRRSLEKGTKMLTIGTQKDTSKAGLEVAERYEGLWASVGLHPNHTCEQEFWDDDELPPEEQATPKIKTRCESLDHEYYLELARHPKCIAVGECGLDYYRIPESVDRDAAIATQKEELRKQLELANETNLPVIFHCRDAHADQQEIIREFLAENKLARRGVVHCFTGTTEEAKIYIDMGFYISFTGIITFPPRKNEGEISPLQQTVKDLPLESILIETDAPYLTPVPRRGERNEPWMVEHVAQKVAELKGVPVEEVAEKTRQNASKLFGIEL